MITVQRVPVARVEIDLLTLTMAEGESRALTAVAKDAKTALIQVLPFDVVTHPGHQVTLRAVDARGNRALATVSVTVDAQGRIVNREPLTRAGGAMMRIAPPPAPPAPAAAPPAAGAPAAQPPAFTSMFPPPPNISK